MVSDREKPRIGSDRAAMPTLPRLESTYSVIIQRAIAAAKVRTGLTQRVKNATRELAALVPHTRERFEQMSVGGKIATVVTLVALGAALALGGVYWLGRRDPAGLRADIEARITAGDWVRAKDLLTELRQTGGLTDIDRLHLVAAVEAGMSKMRSEMQRRLEEQKAAGRYDEAFETLGSMERAGFSGEWMLFTRAELHRLSGNAGASRPYYLRFAELYVTSDRADDALFWAAESAKVEGDRAAARRLLEKLLADYPGSNFKVSARRILGEL